MFFAGVDIGSTTSKCAVVDESKRLLAHARMDTTYDRAACGRAVLERALGKIGADRGRLARLVATGYGRRALETADEVLPEIICHAEGTRFMVPDVRTIIDIGGQDSKVIELFEDGRIVRFQMNDKCAAGTGRFFEVLAGRLLNLDLDDLGAFSLRARTPCTISSICTVFAESEVISLMSEGVAREDIVAGMNLSVAKRVVAMGSAAMVKYPEPIVFTGGVARNEGVAKAFEGLLDKPVKRIARPQMTAALGAALKGLEKHRKEG